MRKAAVTNSGGASPPPSVGLGEASRVKSLRPGWKKKKIYQYLWADNRLSRFDLAASEGRSLTFYSSGRPWSAPRLDPPLPPTPPHEPLITPQLEPER